MEKVTETFEEWRERITKRPSNAHNWQYAGDWFFPTPENRNPQWRGGFFHICEENWRLDVNNSTPQVKSCKKACPSCGTEIPDNIKMIAGLLSW